MESSFVSVVSNAADRIEKAWFLVGGLGGVLEGAFENGAELVEPVREVEDHDPLSRGGGGLEGVFDALGVVPEVGEHDPGDGPGLVTGESVGEDSGGFYGSPRSFTELDGVVDGGVGVVGTGDQEIEAGGEPGLLISAGEKRISGVELRAGVVSAVLGIVAIP